MTEEWLKCQTQKMIVELNRYIWLSDNDIHKKTYVCLIQRASHEIFMQLQHSDVDDMYNNI